MGLKARVIATGEIVEVDECGQTFKDMGWDYMDMRGRCYKSEDLDFRDNTPFDYWTRLEHQYAGMAMQAYIIASHISHFSFCESDMKGCKSMAHALVEKLKEKEERE